jgi:hypothetical protein
MFDPPEKRNMIFLGEDDVLIYPVKRPESIKKQRPPRLYIYYYTLFL